MGFFNLEKPFVIAEISANHGRNFRKAVALIKKAKEAGADAVKFQAYTPDILTIDSNNNFFKVHHPKWGGQTLHSLYSKAYTPWSWFKKLKKIADDMGIVFFASVFDRRSVDLLEEIGVIVHKIASFELVDLPLIEYAARTKKPVILSTGMANLKEISEAIDVAKVAGAEDIAILKCVSSYPARPKDMNLLTIPDLKKRFKLSVGISDHSLGFGVSIAAVALGAALVEKHVKLSSSSKSVDSFFSITPDELKLLIGEVRIAKTALGQVSYRLTKDEAKNKIFRRSLFIVKDIKKGEIFSEHNIRSIRPSYGLKPKYLGKILGKKAKVNLWIGQPLSWKYIER